MPYTPGSLTQDQVISTAKCGEIIHTHGKKFRMGKVNAGQSNSQIRKALAHAIPIGEYPELYQEIIPLVLDVNRSLWGYKLDSHDSLQLLKYTPGCHYDWHMDLGSGGHETRKLSFIIGLSPTESYEGGEVIFKVGPVEKGIKIEQGKMMTFPSFILHKSSPRYKGRTLCSRRLAAKREKSHLSSDAVICIGYLGWLRSTDLTSKKSEKHGKRKPRKQKR